MLNTEEGIRPTKIDSLEEIVEAKYAEAASGDIGPYERIAGFCDYLLKKYGREKVIKTRLFHILARSNRLDQNIFESFDFEGEDSIEKFIREL